jgi:hypothetical protein
MNYFAIGNGFMYIFIASFGVFMGGWLSDNLEDKYPKIKSWVSAYFTLISLPFMMMCLTHHTNFWFSYGMMCCHYLFSEAWLSPALTML